MGALTEQGFIPSTPSEIQENLVNFIKKNNPNFELYPADLQSDLINTSIADLMQYELLTQTMLNTIAPNQSNAWIFNQFASFFGLQQHTNTTNSVTIKATNLPPHAYVPSNLVWTCNGVDFTNNAPTIANANGEASIEAFSNTNTTILEPNQDFTCSEFSNANFSNPAKSQLVNSETFLDFKTRIQDNFKANTQCSYDLLKTELANLGIVNFNVHLTPPTPQNNFVYSQTLIFNPSILNQETEIKNLIFGTMGVNCFLQGATSDNDPTRVRETTIDFFNSQLPIVYVIAKVVVININITIKIDILLEVWQYFIEQITVKINEYFNQSKIGDTINTFLFDNMIYKTLSECKIAIDRLEAINLQFNNNGTPIPINPNDQVIECSAFDTQLQLGSLNVTKATN